MCVQHPPDNLRRMDSIQCDKVTTMRFSKFTFRFFALFISGVIGIQSAQADIYQYVGDEDEIRLTNIESGENYKTLVTEGNSEAPKSNPVTSSVRGKLPYTKEVKAAAKATSLDPALIHAVIATESQHNPRAVSPRGAQGLMQLMPETARRFQLSEPYDPAKMCWQVQNICAS